MKNSVILTTSLILGSLTLVSCSTNKLASSSADDNLYFMASDAKIATEYAVQNNNPEQFQGLSNTASEDIPQESFSSRNVNPDYIARYQAEDETPEEGVVYFDEGGENVNNPDIDAYNNYTVGNSSNFSNFNSSMAFNMGMMYGMSPWGMGGFYNPYMGMGYGFRPGFNLSLGFGFGFGNPFYNSFYRPSYGMMGFYDPWGPVYYGMGGYGYGYPGYGYSPMFPSNPVYILPGGEYGDRRIVRGARPTRGSSLAGTRTAGVSNAALQPSTARAQARRDVLNNGATSRRIVSNSDNSRVSARDFSSSQNDYYNSRSRQSVSRNIGSAAMDRPVSRTRSAMPSARPSVGTTNSRSINPGRSGSVRTSYPNSSTRSSSPSYNRSNVPTRTSSPSYNRSNTNTRTITPSRSSSPVRSSSPTMSTPSRSTGGSGTSGVSRSSSAPTRSTRGN